MLRPRLFWKFFGASFALILLTVIVAGWIASNRIVAQLEEETKTNLEHQVAILHAWVLPRLPKRPTVDFQAAVEALGKDMGTRVTVIATDGVVLADSLKDPAGMDNHGTRPEVLASQRGPYGRSVRRSDTLQRRMVYVARAILRDGEFLGTIRGALPLVQLEDRMAAMRSTILGAGLFAVAVGLLAALLLARRLAGPLRSMTGAATAIAAGDYKRRVRAYGGDEVGELGRAFNEMAARLDEEVSQIRQDQRELRAILSGMAEGVIAVDADERIMLLNDAAGEILGIKPIEASGRPVWEVLRLPQIPETLAAAVRQGEDQTARMKLIDNGRTRIVRLHVSPLQGRHGTRHGAVLVLQDITQRERVDAVRTDFFTNASHELQTPIASMRGLIETVLDDAEMDPETRREFLERVQRQGLRLGELVEEMLALARLEAQGRSATEHVRDARLPLQDALDAVAPLAAEYGVAIDAHLGEEAVGVRGQEEALRRIAGNLLDNAIKYCSRGGHVEVRVAGDGHDFVLTVRDDGPGIPPDKQDRVFERFYRVDEGRSREAGGSGLGLAIVKHLVQSLDGRIELASTLGRGSTFTVTLPRA